MLFFFSTLVFGQSSELNFDQPELQSKAPDKADSFAQSPWAKMTPSLDLRFVGLLRERPSETGKQGFSIMQGILGLDFEADPVTQIVSRYNLGFLGPGTRELYIAYTGWSFLEELKVGRFTLSFGNKLSDHRVYTKKFFGVSVNDFETGLEISKALGPSKLTFALVQGLGTGEAFLNNRVLLTPVLDWRIDFGGDTVSATLGLSALRSFRVEGAAAPTDRSSVVALFGELRMYRASWLNELYYGHKRNRLAHDTSSFVEDSSYASAILDKDSMGMLSLFTYKMNSSLNPFYEYDQMVFDIAYHADRFQKHALGISYRASESLDLELRFEKQYEGRSKEPDLRRHNDCLLASIHSWF